MNQTLTAHPIAHSSVQPFDRQPIALDTLTTSKTASFQPHSSRRDSSVISPPKESLSTATTSLNLFNFSQSPTQTETFTDSRSKATALFKNSNAFASGDSNATFIGGLNAPIAETNVAINTFNLASGIGKRYNADSSSIAIVKGLGFYIAPKEVFKFDFNGLTTLGAESTSSRENAFARSKTRIVIYATDSHGTQTPIDRLLISTRQTAKGSELNLKASNGFGLSATIQPLSLTSNELSFNGTYSRTFDTATQLSFIATQTAQTKASRSRHRQSHHR